MSTNEITVNDNQKSLESWTDDKVKVHINNVIWDLHFEALSQISQKPNDARYYSEMAKDLEKIMDKYFPEES